MKEFLQTYSSLMRRTITNGANKWCKQMKVLFGCLDVLEVIKNDVNPIVECATYAQERKKKDFKTRFLIHQCVDTKIFEKVGNCESLKQV